MDKSLAGDGGDGGGPVSTAEFEKVMVSIGFDPALSSFKGEYAKLLGALKGSLATEKRLVAKIGGLNEEIVLNAGRVSQALRLAEEDGATIDDLRKQLERAWAMVEASSTRAEAAGQNAQTFQAEAEQHKGELSRLHGLLGGASVEELAAARDSLSSRLDAAQGSLASEKARADSLVVELEARSQKLTARREEVRGLRAELALKAGEEAKVARMVASLQADVARGKEEAVAHAAGEAGARALKADMEASLARLQKALEAQRASTTAALAEASDSAAALRRTQEELKGFVDRAAAAGEAKAGLERELREAREALFKEKSGAAKGAARIEALGKELAAAAARSAGAATELAALRAELVAVGKSLSAEQLAVKDRERKAARLGAEKAAAQARVAAGESKLSEAEVEAAAAAAEVKALGEQVRELAAALAKARAVVVSLQRAVESERSECDKARAGTAEALEACAVKEAMVAELEAREREAVLKLRTANAAFEGMRGERNSAVKAAGAAEEEVREGARKERILCNQVSQLKEEVMAKDKWLVTEQFEAASLGKRLNTKSSECDKLRALLEEAAGAVKRQGEDLARAHGLLRGADSDSLAQKRAFDGLVGERDALASQLKSRNDDLVLATARMGVLEVTLGKGEKAYAAKELEVRALKIKVSRRERGQQQHAGHLPPLPLLSLPHTHPPPHTPTPCPQIADMLREQQLSLSASTGIPPEARTQITSLQRDLDREKAKVSSWAPQQAAH